MIKDRTIIFNDEIELYKANYNVIFSDTVLSGMKDAGLFKKYYKYIGSENESKSDAKDFLKSCDGMFVYLAKDDYYVVLLELDIVTSVIAHESFHLVCKVLREKGIYLSEDTEEAYAYTLDHVVEKIVGFQKKAKKQIKKGGS